MATNFGNNFSGAHCLRSEKKVHFDFEIFSLLPYKMCFLAAASHAPRGLARMKIRKIILCYCAQ